MTAESTRSEWHRTLSIGLIVILAHLAFLSFAATVMAPGGGTLETVVAHQDAEEYISIAESLVSGNGFRMFDFPEPETFRTIGYPLFLAILHFLTEGSFLAVLVSIAVSGGITAALIYLIGRKLALPPAYACAAALLFGISPAIPTLTMTGMGSDLFFIMLALGAVYAALHLNDSKRPLLLAAFVGFVLGYAALTRPVGHALGLLLILALPLLSGLPLPSWKKHGVIALSVFIVFSATLFPWLARNYVVAGHFGLSSHPAYSLYYDFIPEYYAFSRGTSAHDELQVLLKEVDNPPGHILRSFAYTDTLMAYNRAFLAEHFLPYALFHVAKTATFFLGSGVNVAYTILSIEGNLPPASALLPAVHENLAKLVYTGQWDAAFENLRTYLPATLERVIWLVLFLSLFASPFVVRNPRARRFLIVGIAFTLLSALLSGPVSQPRLRAPAEPFVWLSAALVAHALVPMLRNLFRKILPVHKLGE